MIANQQYIERLPEHYYKALALDKALLLQFVQETQPDEWAKLETQYTSAAKDKFLKQLEKALKTRGVLDVLRQGIKLIPGIKFSLCFFRPVSNLNTELVRLYEANILSVIRQVQYSQKPNKLGDESKKAIDVALPKKTVTIHDLKLLELLEADTPHPKLVLDVACSSGTYIRSLARDIGTAVGCGAFLSKLVRTEHGKFSSDHAVPLAAIEQAHDPLQYLQHPKKYLEMPVVDLPEEELFKKLANGMKIEPEIASPKLKTNQLYFVEYHTRPVAVAQAIQGKLKPIKVFPL